jgi:hypothetical protein
VVWEPMTYIARPPLPPEEAKQYLAYRRWAAQFYPEAAAPAGAGRCAPDERELTARIVGGEPDRVDAA